MYLPFGSNLGFFDGVESFSPLDDSDSLRFFIKSAITGSTFSSLAIAGFVDAALVTAVPGAGVIPPPPAPGATLSNCSGVVAIALSTSARPSKSSGRSHTDVLVDGL